MSCSPRTKKTSAQAVESDLRVQLAHLHGQVTERKASNASNEKDSSSSAFNSRALTKRVQDSSKQEMQTAAESAMSDQRARYRAKLTATRSELDMTNSSIAAMAADLDAMRRDHELERTVLKNDLEDRGGSAKGSLVCERQTACCWIFGKLMLLWSISAVAVVPQRARWRIPWTRQFAPPRRRI